MIKLLHIHKWNYYTGEVVFKGSKKTETLQFRICKRCGEKQKTNYRNIGVWNFHLKRYCNWEECEKTKQEIRDFKLNKLIKNE